MIKLTHLNKKEFVLNSDLILYIEETPDTLILLTTGEKILVKESVDRVVELVVGFKRKLYDGVTRLNVVYHGRPELPELPAESED